MKIFISWSGKQSQVVAEELRKLLPLVLPNTKPWLSKADIKPGERWANVLGDELSSSSVGVLCLTPENLKSDWMHFEAGALAKQLESSRVIPLLWSLDVADISGPLSQFQAVKFGEKGLLEVLKEINKASPTPRDEAQIEELFDALWSKVESATDKIPEPNPDEATSRPEGEILEDLVTSVRMMESVLRETEASRVKAEERGGLMRHELVMLRNDIRSLHARIRFIAAGGVLDLSSDPEIGDRLGELATSLRDYYKVLRALFHTDADRDADWVKVVEDPLSAALLDLEMIEAIEPALLPNSDLKKIRRDVLHMKHQYDRIIAKANDERSVSEGSIDQDKDVEN